MSQQEKDFDLSVHKQLIILCIDNLNMLRS